MQYPFQKSDSNSWDPQGNSLDSLILVLMIAISLWSPSALTAGQNQWLDMAPKSFFLPTHLR